jgi:YD repeat-containing protein
MDSIAKYPRTPHLEGSRLQPGDHDLEAVPLEVLRGRFVVVEEKLDGANAGISLGPDGVLRLQSRGHYLVGGPRERHFAPFKRWAATHAGALTELLAGGLVMYGEWLYAKHTIFYDHLPHWFMEFDILDGTGVFWSTARRAAHLAPAGIVTSVPVVWQGVVDKPAELPALVARALYKSERWRDRLREVALGEGLDPDRVARETDPSDDAEGLYVKVEHGDRVIERYKWIRPGFLTAVVDADGHWLSRPIVPNQLAAGVDVFAGAESS